MTTLCDGGLDCLGVADDFNRSFFLTLLRRIPDDVILALATTDLTPHHHGYAWDASGYKICEQAVRADFARCGEPSTLGSLSAPALCAERFGGPADEWRFLYRYGYGERAQALEVAFAERLDEAVIAALT